MDEHAKSGGADNFGQFAIAGAEDGDDASGGGAIIGPGPLCGRTTTPGEDEDR